MSSVFRANDRINLYPAAPIRLATMLHTWTITKRGMGLIFGTAPSPSGHSVTHPTRQQTPPLGMRPVGTLSGSTVSSDDGTLRDQSSLQITPKRDRQFARQGDDHDAPDAPLLTLRALMEPLAQGAIRLMPEPKPCGFDHGHPGQPIARLGDALAAASVAAVKEKLEALLTTGARRSMATEGTTAAEIGESREYTYESKFAGHPRRGR